MHLRVSTQNKRVGYNIRVCVKSGSLEFWSSFRTSLQMTHTNMLSGRADSATCQNQQRHIRRCRPHAICFSYTARKGSPGMPKTTTSKLQHLIGSQSQQNPDLPRVLLKGSVSIEPEADCQPVQPKATKPSTKPSTKIETLKMQHGQENESLELYFSIASSYLCIARECHRPTKRYHSKQQQV